jgi:hypothetical protein
VKFTTRPRKYERTVLVRFTGLVFFSEFSLSSLFSPTYKRTEGRAPVWGSEFTSKDAALQGGIQQKPLLGRLHVKLRVLVTGGGRILPHA